MLPYGLRPLSAAAEPFIPIASAVPPSLSMDDLVMCPLAPTFTLDPIFHSTLFSFSRSLSILTSTISLCPSAAFASAVDRYHNTPSLTVRSVWAWPSSSRCAMLLTGSCSAASAPPAAHLQSKLLGLPYLRSRRAVSAEDRTDSAVLSEEMLALRSRRRREVDESISARCGSVR